MINELMKVIAKERPVGTQENSMLINYLEKLFADMDYSTRSLPFNCLVWSKDNSTVNISGQKYDISPSPFSKPFSGAAQCIIVGSLDELKEADSRGKILILQNELTKTSMQPKDYPFYYPDEHREIINMLENSGAIAILTVTGKHPIYELNPFYFFEDGNFILPSAYISVDVWKEIEPHLKGEDIKLHIGSRNDSATSYQLIARKAAKDAIRNIMVCAHMDSKYNTPAALDNAAGLALMIRTMDFLKDYKLDYNIEFIPFNSEEYFGATGELIYLEDCKQRGNAPDLVINMDSPGHFGSKIAVSSYNVDPNISRLLDSLSCNHQNISAGPEWYSGDHVIYSMKGVPSIAIASTDFYEGGLMYAHTQKDTLDTVDCNLLECGAKFLAEFLKSIIS